jgi:hypothetical protein
MTREELKVLAHKAILKKQVGVSTLDIRLWKWLDRDLNHLWKRLGVTKYGTPDGKAGTQV